MKLDIVNTLKKKRALILIFIAFTLLYTIISFINHSLFRTYALDLGVYNHAVYNFSQFKSAVFTLGIDGNEVSFLATHFSLITILYAPLVYIFGSFTLLVIQIASILFGGYFIYKYALNFLGNNPKLPYWILIHFFSIWGIYSALSFDYHDNVLGAMLIPAFVYYVEKRNMKLSALLLILILFTKEVMAVWLFFILIGLIIKNRKSYYKTYINFELPLLIFCFIYGLVVIFFLMPMLQGETNNLQFIRYNYLGNSVFEIIVNVFKNPKLIVDVLFTNILNDPSYDYIKMETYIMFILAGGLFCFFKPAYLIMLLPIFAQKFLSNDYGFWGINGQYSIEFVPIISLATIDFIRNYKKNQVVAMIIITLITLGTNIKTIESRESKWYNAANTKFYSKMHFKTELDIAQVNEALNLIEKESSVSASSSIVPHIAFREKIYHFPIIKEADYIALFKNRDFWPLTLESFNDNLKQLKADNLYSVIFESEDLILFKKSSK